MTDIPPAIARQLCFEIEATHNGLRRLTFNGLWCWGCAHSSGDASRRCFATRSNFRGCPQVNARFARLSRIDHVPDESGYLFN